MTTFAAHTAVRDGRIGTGSVTVVAAGWRLAPDREQQRPADRMAVGGDQRQLST